MANNMRGERIMRAEHMRRLLWKGGIVGYEWLEPNTTGVTAHRGQLQNLRARVLEASEIRSMSDRAWYDNFIHDSIEQGYQMPDGTWWFVGDKGREKDKHIPEFELMYEGLTLKMKYSVDPHPAIIRVIYNIEMLSSCEHLGSIHDEPDKKENHENNDTTTD